VVAPPDQRSPDPRQAPGRAHRRRHRRRLRGLLGVVVVLAVLAGGALVAAPVVDGAVRDAAQERVAQVVARQTGAAGGVDVEVGGAWFVPQALAGRYPAVRVVARDVPTEGPRLAEVRADLRDVDVPLRDVLGGTPQVRVASSTARVLLAYPELNAVLAGQDPPLEVAPAAEQLRVTTSAEVLGREVGLSGLVALEVGSGEGGTAELRAVPTSLDTGVGLLDRLSRRVLQGLSDQLAFTAPLGGLPFDLEVTGAVVQDDGVVVSAAGGAAVLG